MPRRKSRVFRLPSNAEIVATILQRYRDKGVIGASYQFGRRYQLSPEDREELVSHVNYKLARIDWRAKFRSNFRYVLEHYPHHSATWTAQELAGFFNGYIWTVIRKSMLDEVRRIKCGGLSGLGLHALDSIQPHDAFGYDDYREKTEGAEDAFEPSADGQADRTAARQVAEIAQQMLSTEEWLCISLAFGFDGGDSRTPTQVAREAQLPRREVQQLLDSAMGKLRVRCE